MGTRCVTHVKGNNGQTLVTLYRQFDGYPSGHGVELLEFLDKKILIDGIRDETLDNAFNGMGCLSAALIANFKKEIGGFYIVAADSRAQYVYVVEPDETGGVRVTVNGELLQEVLDRQPAAEFG